MGSEHTRTNKLPFFFVHFMLTNHKPTNHMQQVLYSSFQEHATRRKFSGTA